MKFPLSWLQQFIAVDQPLTTFAESLTLLGIEVDHIETTSPPFSGVIVVEVLATKPHPQADRLCLATISDGKQTVDVVCGAPNCRKGLRTAFAPVGALLTDGERNIKVKKSKIRGIESAGMLCSKAELGMGDDHTGIIELDENLPLGFALADNETDTLFEVSLTPNLAHALSLLGIAREWSACSHNPLQIPSSSTVEGALPIEKHVTVSLKDPVGCPRYACRWIRDVTVQPSPEWLQKALIGCGIRPVNNVVDVTNYVLMERGHPLHAFDYDQIAGHEIYVRSAYEGETFTTLDDQEHTLSQDIVVIADAEKAVAIGGVMGGKNSEVRNETKNILLEAAYFHPHSIRMASKHLGIQSESSRRFERGVDPNGVLPALDRAAELIRQIAGGEVAQGVVDEGKRDFPPEKIPLRLSHVERILGRAFSLEEVTDIFTRLGCTVSQEDPLIVTVPTYRVDVTTEIDLIEEIARLYGYSHFSRQIERFSANTIPHDPLYLLEKEIRSTCVSMGLQEWITCDLIGPSAIHVVGDTTTDHMETITVLNPTSIDQSILRTSLLPGMLQCMKRNQDRQIEDTNAFEIGRTHRQKGDTIEEPSTLGILLCGKEEPHFWGRKSRPIDFFTLKGKIESILLPLRVARVEYVSTELPFLHPGRQASLFIDSIEMGFLGEIHPAILRRLDTPQKAFFAELNLQKLMKHRSCQKTMQPLPVYPCSKRDWTVTLPKTLPVADVFHLFQEAPSRLLEKISLADIYESEKIGEDRHNLTFHMVYRDSKKTVSQEVVEKEHQRLLTYVQQQLKNNDLL